ncbi:MAG: DsrE family protein [Candidatus Hodarchaeales archaeon]
MDSVLIICDKGPFGTNSVFEAMRLGSGFLALGEDVNCKLILMGDAVLFMRSNLQQDTLGMDSLEDGIEMADLSELPVILIREDMEERGVSESDLVEYENIAIISKNDLAKEIDSFSAVFRM